MTDFNDIFAKQSRPKRAVDIRSILVPAQSGENAAVIREFRNKIDITLKRKSATRPNTSSSPGFEAHELEISADDGWITAAPALGGNFDQWPAFPLPERKTKGIVEFSLSAETLALLRSAIAIYADRKLPYSDKFVFSKDPIALTDQELTALVLEQVELIFAALARRLAQDDIRQVVLTLFGEFLPEIDVLIQSRIPFPPRYMGHLSDQIFSQMQNQAIAEKMGGSWGHFSRNLEGEIVLIIKLEPNDRSVNSGAKVEIEEL